MERNICAGGGAAASGDGTSLVGSEALLFFEELVTDLGGETPLLLAEAQVDPSSLRKAGAPLRYGDLVRLLALAAERLGVADFGLRLAQRQRGGKVIGPIGVVMKNSETIGQALGYCAKHIHAYSLATRVRFKPDRSRHILFVSLNILLEEMLDSRQVVEHALLLANLNIVDISGGRARLREVHFRHMPQMPVREYRRHFSCEVLFDQAEDGFVLTESDLLCPIAEPDEQIHEMAVDYIDARFPPATPPLRLRVRSLILNHLDGDCTYERIASEMCMHPRTLQRRLRAEGGSFESIKDDVRRQVALRYLRQREIPLTRVAQKLGYAEASVLSRSCLRWFEASPQEIRRVGMARPGGPED
ncbi:AraC family transcriptional regulator [Sandaracinobacter sp. RS1-74]|uniref:AraC family transcriptional regulator n=1 Tax=Sandaracinobacteroides sayramensis TaxID=2913411 RepID=UPI001EDA9755|nr:AraC family transcriptional regulator [Sandaracinobacteroides sayramensis]MCG2842024.1 AraC family transcriptional regulator [Sandaracinobacteroides sayramensis]